MYKRLWTKIKGYEKYIISAYGEVINTETYKNIAHVLHMDGYYVSIGPRNNRKVLKVANILATIYIPNTENKECIMFLDGDHKNHSITNIAWATRSQIKLRSNIYNRDSYKKNVGIKRKKVFQYMKEGIRVGSFNSTMEVERMLGFNYNKIGEACRGERKTYKGFIWKYE